MQKKKNEGVPLKLSLYASCVAAADVGNSVTDKAHVPSVQRLTM
jgi:hypothetical protein